MCEVLHAARCAEAEEAVLRAACETAVAAVVHVPVRVLEEAAVVHIPVCVLEEAAAHVPVRDI